MEFNHELLKKLTESENDIHVLICMDTDCSAYLPQAEESCRLCGHHLWLDKGNVGKIADGTVTPVCVWCWSRHLIEHSDIDKAKALIGGEFLSVKEGLEAVGNLMEPPPEEEVN